MDATDEDSKNIGNEKHASPSKEVDHSPAGFEALNVGNTSVDEEDSSDSYSVSVASSYTYHSAAEEKQKEQNPFDDERTTWPIELITAKNVSRTSSSHSSFVMVDEVAMEALSLSSDFREENVDEEEQTTVNTATTSLHDSKVDSTFPLAQFIEQKPATEKTSLDEILTVEDDALLYPKYAGLVNETRESPDGPSLRTKEKTKALSQSDLSEETIEKKCFEQAFQFIQELAPILQDSTRVKLGFHPLRPEALMPLAQRFFQRHFHCCRQQNPVGEPAVDLAFVILENSEAYVMRQVRSHGLLTRAECQQASTDNLRYNCWHKTDSDPSEGIPTLNNLPYKKDTVIAEGSSFHATVLLVARIKQHSVHTQQGDVLPLSRGDLCLPLSAVPFSGRAWINAIIKSLRTTVLELVGKHLNLVPRSSVLTHPSVGSEEVGQEAQLTLISLVDETHRNNFPFNEHADYTYKESSKAYEECIGDCSYFRCSLCKLYFRQGDSVVSLKPCNHMYHRSCVENLQSTGEACTATNCEQKLNQASTSPSGTMLVSFDVPNGPCHWSSTRRTNGLGTIIMSFLLPRAQQEKGHPNPKKWHSGFCKTAFLPLTKEGNAIRLRMQLAFALGRLFKIVPGAGHPDTVVATVKLQFSLFAFTKRRTHRECTIPQCIPRCNADLTKLGIVNVPFTKTHRAETQHWPLHPPQILPATRDCVGVFHYCAGLPPPWCKVYVVKPTDWGHARCCSCKGVFSKTDDIVSLKACGHLLHRHCSKKFEKSGETCPGCAYCLIPSRPPLATTSPSGTMRIAHGGLLDDKAEVVENDIFRIHIWIPEGTQGDHHPKPRRKYNGLQYETIVPNTCAAVILMEQLKRAFHQGVLLKIVPTENPSSCPYDQVTPTVHLSTAHFYATGKSSQETLSEICQCCLSLEKLLGGR